MVGGEQEEFEPLPDALNNTTRRRSASGGGVGGSVLFNPPISCDGWCHTTVSDDTVYEYVWTIDSFERIAKSYPNSKTMYSEQFVIPLKKRFTVWRLKIYPNGRTPEDTGYITIFLKDSGQIEPAKVRAVAEFSIIDHVGNRRNLKQVDKEFKVLNHSFGFNKFVKHTDLFANNSPLLSDGRLSLACRITIRLVDTENHTSQVAQYLQESQELSENATHISELKAMLTSGDFSDCVIKCQGDEEILCHKAMLAARSSYFKAMFSSNMVEKITGTIKVEETKETCLNLLEFIYTGRIANHKLTLDIFEAADKYNLQDLLDQCTSYLKKTLDRENCIQTFVVADRHSNLTLRAAAKDFILDNTAILTGTDRWKEELSTYPSLLTELLEGVVSTHPQGRRSWIELAEEDDGTPVAKRRRKH
eukprot:TRINITY_DN5142_c0_g1_i1.p1 TRINITY_DN5142_c0_g1~~TRINITY_DN5142_c0_g1_i1.p1  ORF type:complete len:418 (+),score=94.34 TRINITY_DN5142_c0_g1_i1:48-1301(+)